MTVADAPTASVAVVKNRPDSYYTMCDRGPMPGAGAGAYRAPWVNDYTTGLKFQNRQTINAGFGACMGKDLCDYLQ